MTDADRLREAGRKTRDALQVVDALRGEAASLGFHLTLEELATLLASIQTTCRNQ